MKDVNYDERVRLFRDARKFKVSEKQLEVVTKLLSDRMRQRGGNDTYLKTKNPLGKEVFVGWIAKWGDRYCVTFMGYSFGEYGSFSEACEALAQMALALHSNTYTFKYGV